MTMTTTMTMTPQQAILRARPLINAKRQYGGMRVVIDNFLVDDDDVRNTLALLAEEETAAQHPLIVAFSCERMPTPLQDWQPGANTYPELHGDWLSLSVTRDLLASAKYPLWCLNGVSGAPLDPALTKSLTYIVATAASAHCGGAIPSSQAGKSRVYTGVGSRVDADAVFAKGGQWIAGWPMLANAAPPAIKPRNAEGRASAFRLLAMVQTNADICEIEAVLKLDPALAFKLLRLINSAANGLSLQVQSLSHAVVILGYQRLARWLAVLAMSSNDDPNFKPVMGISLRRAYFMERIGKLLFSEVDPYELFITGLFSLLDVIFTQPFEELLEKMYLPDAVADSLDRRGEPYGLLLSLAEAMEGDDAGVIRDLTQLLGLSTADVNRALLMAIRDTDLVAME